MKISLCNSNNNPMNNKKIKSILLHKNLLLKYKVKLINLFFFLREIPFRKILIKFRKKK